MSCVVVAGPSSSHRRLAAAADPYDSVPMPRVEGGLTGIAVFNGGPMDGQEHPVDGDTDELCAVMTDGQQHRYTRTDRVQRLADGRSAVVFHWRGRYYGPK